MGEIDALLNHLETLATEVRKSVTVMRKCHQIHLEEFSSIRETCERIKQINIAIRCTPAIAARVESSAWTVRDLVDKIEA